MDTVCMILLDIERYRGHNLTNHLHSLVHICLFCLFCHPPPCPSQHQLSAQVLEFVDCHGNEVLHQSSKTKKSFESEKQVFLNIPFNL